MLCLLVRPGGLGLSIVGTAARPLLCCACTMRLPARAQPLGFTLNPRGARRRKPANIGMANRQPDSSHDPVHRRRRTARPRAAWREWVFQHFGGLESDLYGDTDFDGHMAASHAGDVILTKLEANRHRVLRSPHLARTSETGYLKIVAPWQGSAAGGAAGPPSLRARRRLGDLRHHRQLRHRQPRARGAPDRDAAQGPDGRARRAPGRPDGAPRRRRQRHLARGAGNHAQHLPGTAAHERGDGAAAPAS